MFGFPSCCFTSPKVKSFEYKNAVHGDFCRYTCSLSIVPRYSSRYEADSRFPASA